MPKQNPTTDAGTAMSLSFPKVKRPEETGKTNAPWPAGPPPASKEEK